MSDTPDWFWEAVDTQPESGEVEVDDCDINYLKWSEASDQGLLFIHGHNANAHWWDFIAPFFKDDYQTVAMDMSGMGDSGHRDAYSNDTYAAEMIAVADALAMPAQTVLIAHSFGGMMAQRTIAKNPERFKGLILVDSGVRHPEDIEERDTPIERWTKPKIYPSQEVALSRFRLQPAQQCENQYLVNYIARHSAEYDGGEEGWVWTFDDELNSRMTMASELEDDFKAIDIPVALIYGANSESFKPRSAQYMKEMKPSLQLIELADAQHHLFLDQPMAFVEAVKDILAKW
jgi:pimeloyl-ACP methyl ester carboxylesterase